MNDPPWLCCALLLIMHPPGESQARQPEPCMTQQFLTPFSLLRRKQVEAETGYARSTIYLRISQGLFIKPISLGARAVGFPAGEVATLNAARIAGRSETEIRALVAKLEAARGSAGAD